MVAIAFLDIRRAMRLEGGEVTFYHSDTWSDGTTAAVGAVSQVFDKEGSYIDVEIKFHDKAAMLREFLKHFSIWVDDEETAQAGLALTRLLKWG
jgi:hypothetical protein